MDPIGQFIPKFYNARKKRIVISVCSSKGKVERMRGGVIRSAEMRNKVFRRKVEVTMVNFVSFFYFLELVIQRAQDDCNN